MRELRKLATAHRITLPARPRKADYLEALELAGVTAPNRKKLVERPADSERTAHEVATPERLGAAGRALWRDLSAAFEFDERELVILATAARQADDVALLEAAIAADGIIVTGSQGQPRLSATVTEVRQGRIALAKLLGELRLPDNDQPDAPARNARSARAQHAARSRWSDRGTPT